MMTKIIVATGNVGKMREFKEILSDLPLELSSLKDHWNPVPDIAETGSTFIENAMIKADWVFGKTDLWSLADDSGLEVDALNGAPGVYSARFSGEDATSEKNNVKLLQSLKDVPIEKRTARFKCVLVLRTSLQNTIVAEGTCEGHIGFEISGNQGFGYDPLFFPTGFDKTFAELGSSQKHAISHRGNALKQLQKELHEFIR